MDSPGTRGLIHPKLERVEECCHPIATLNANLDLFWQVHVPKKKKTKAAMEAD